MSLLRQFAAASSAGRAESAVARLTGYFDKGSGHVKSRLTVAAGVVVAVVFAAWLTYATGGTQYVYLHLMYLPIVVAGMVFGLAGGVLTGVVGGLLVGPVMPISVEAGTMQPWEGWLYRLGFFALIGGVAGATATAVNQKVAKVAGTYARTLRAFSSLVALRDEQTGGHCERVAHNACAVGELLGVRGSELQALYWAGILHDLGKVATPAEILLKPGRLTEGEYREVQKHAAAGAELLLSISNDFAPIAAGVRSHHERWDGCGYPDGLKAQAIPLFGRILAVVDVFEALTSKRPYRGPMPAEEALAHVQRELGQHFDPEVVAAFEQLYFEGRVCVAEHDRHSVPARYEAPVPVGLVKEPVSVN